MTETLKQYLKSNKHLIEEEKFDALFNNCPLNFRKELCLFLLECTDNDTTIIPKDRTLDLFNEELKKYLPTASLCYCWLTYYKGTKEYYQNNPMPIRRGTLTYVAVVENEIVTDNCEWSVATDLLNSKVIAVNCAKDLAEHIKERL